ncbi:MAG: hypothetical protein WEA77_10545 [Hyphomonas sp.]|uniref:hypothetical protein n=1 Tax=Hyphomonas sp. TaxID=87 RepID=UPI0034A03E9F
MSRLVDAIESAGYGDRILTETQLSRIVGGGDASRYGLVNRALKDGSLIRIRRGLYAISTRQPLSIHPFVVAQSLRPGSYISFESALSFHGWIPEAVYTTTSVTPDRKTIERETDVFGHFSFNPIAIKKYGFLISVDRVTMGASIALVAQPLRALMDLVAFRKTDWQGMGWIEDGLRIDLANLETLRKSDFSSLRPVYKHKRARRFLDEFETAVLSLKSAHPRRKETSID